MERRYGPRSHALRALMAVCGAVLFVLILSVAAVGSGHYALSVPDSIDTPERTVTIEGDDYVIDALASREPGELLTVDVTVGDDESFNVDLFNSERDVEDWNGSTGSQQVSFETDNLEPGTYVLALHADANYQVIHPVVIAGYDVTVDAPSNAQPGDIIEITVDVDEGALTEQPTGVEVAVWNFDEHLREDATAINDWEYQATVDLSGLSEGEYFVYAVAQGSEEFNGEPEVLAVSGEHSLTIEESNEDDADEDDGANGAAGGGVGGAAGDDDADKEDAEAEVEEEDDADEEDADKAEAEEEGDEEKEDAVERESEEDEAEEPTDDEPEEDDAGAADEEDEGPSETDADDTDTEPDRADDAIIMPAEEVEADDEPAPDAERLLLEHPGITATVIVGIVTLLGAAVFTLRRL